MTLATGHHIGLINHNPFFMDMRTMRIRKTIAKHLQEVGDPRSFRQILDWVNSNTRHGTTPSQLCNVLAKNPEFIQWDTIKVRGVVSGKYDLTVWVHETYMEEEE